MWRVVGRWVRFEAFSEAFRWLALPVLSAAVGGTLYIVFLWASGPLWMRIVLLVAVPALIFTVGLIAQILLFSRVSSKRSPTPSPRSTDSRQRGWLDHYVDAEQGLETLGNTLESTTQDANWANKRIIKHTKNFVKAKDNPKRMHKRARETGDDLVEFARRISLRNAELEAAADAPERLALYLEQSPLDATADELAGLHGEVTAGLAATRSLRESVASLRTAMRELRNKNVSADLNNGAGAAIDAVGLHVRIMRRIERSLETLLATIARAKAAEPTASPQSTPDTSEGQQ